MELKFKVGIDTKKIDLLTKILTAKYIYVFFYNCVCELQSMAALMFPCSSLVVSLPTMGDEKTACLPPKIKARVPPLK